MAGTAQQVLLANTLTTFVPFARYHDKIGCLLLAVFWLFLLVSNLHEYVSLFACQGLFINTYQPCMVQTIMQLLC